jgi:branched-subunit amino acid aminotransferase/4-amino-4-deoxychorismate lyase
LAAGDDLGLSIFVTPGLYSAYAGSGPVEPTVCLHTYPLPFGRWAGKYRTGQGLVTTGVEQVPAECWPPTLKCRSRMHYYLADRRAQAAEPGSRALLLDGDGFVCEASTANVVAYFADAGLVSPRHDKILPGISIAVLMELAARLGIPFSERDLTPHDLAAADEVILTGTSPCLLPAVRLGGRPIAAGTPGDCYRRLLAAWNELVGIDIVAQATMFAARQTDRPTAVPRILAHGEDAEGAVFGEAV